MLRVNVGVERATAEVVPGDDRSTRAVRDDGGTQLVGGSGAHDTAVRRPSRIHASSGQDVLSVAVGVGAAATAVVLPRDDRPARAIGHDCGQALLVGGGAQRAAVFGPGGVHAAGEDMLGVDVGARAAGTLIGPRDDRAA